MTLETPSGFKFGTPRLEIQCLNYLNDGNTTYMKMFHLGWLKLKDSTPEHWKFIINENHENATNFIINSHPLIKGSKVIALDKRKPYFLYKNFIYLE